MVIVYLEEVVEVATHFLGRTQVRSQFMAVVFGILVPFLTRQHGKLDIPGQVKLPLDSFHVLLFFDAVPDFGKHLGEGRCKLRNLVMPRYFRNGHVEIELAQFLCSKSQVTKWPCHT